MNILYKYKKNIFNIFFIYKLINNIISKILDYINYYYPYQYLLNY